MSAAPRTAPRGAPGPARPDILRCVHCGLCLSACPTYRETRKETESPRGRIYLMRALAEERLAPSREVSRHFDLCLNCRACETACPAGVHYGLLYEMTRERVRAELPRRLGERVRDWTLTHVFPYPERLRLVLALTRGADALGLLALARGRLGRALPPALRVAAELWPSAEDAAANGPGLVPSPAPVPPGTYPPYEGPPRARVAWFSTCLMPGTFPGTDRAAVHLLREAGAVVVVPERQGCCGSLHAHAGLRETARGLARANLAWYRDEGPFDFVATDVAGCGATLAEYDELLPGTEEARDFATRVRDVTEVLAGLGLPAARALVPETIGVHDACHLAHARGVREAPRRLLRALPGARVVDLPFSDRCCGSAGVYNLVQPEMADRLLEQKMDAVVAARPTVVAVGNAGCLLQMQRGARRRGMAVPMRHPVEIVARAYPRAGALEPAP